MDNSLPLVSVGLPVYNGEKYIETAIASILAQTYPNFELIISDNASTDATPDICRHYAELDNRIRFYRNESNIGAAKNFQRVFQLSRGKYFKWTGHDDISAPGLLERLVNVLEHNPAVILSYSRTTRIDENGNIITVDYTDGLDLRYKTPHDRFRHFHDRFKKDSHCEPAFGLIRREVLQKTRLIDNYVGADEIMLGELALMGEFYEVEESLFFRRIHPGAAGHANRSLKALATWYDPANSKKIHLKRWKMLSGYMGAVSRVDIHGPEKVKCYAELVKWSIRHWKGLSFDLLQASNQLAGRVFTKKN